MLLSLWNYLRGYVIIEVTGFSVERFVNLAVHKGVYIWDAVYSENGVTMKVSIKAFKMLKTCAKKTKCRIKIRGKMGYPFIVHRYRKRKFLLAGFVFFVMVIYTLSTFVWLVELEGTDKLNRDEIIEFCKKEGLTVGAFKYKIDTKELEKKLIKKYSDISWINIHIKGTKASIKLTEIIPKQKIVDRKTPCNIIASKDGLIVSIATSAGTPLVKQQDVVHKGDMLVSGELVVKNDETGIIKEYVHADSDVFAKIYYDINFDVPFFYTEKQYTQNSKKQYGFIVFDKEVNLLESKIPYTNYKKTISRKQLKLGENYPLPIIFLTTEFKEFIPVEKQRTVEQAKELAERMVTGRIIREFDFETDVIDKKIDFAENENELIVKALITTLENIGEEEILIEKEENQETPMNPIE